MATRILVVDDDLSLLALLKTALEQQGYQVSTAASAEAGLELIETADINLTLLDIYLPGIDGLELLTRLREKNRKMPVIVMTGDATQEAVIHALRKQACDFLEKPFEISELISAIESALAHCVNELRIEVISAKPEWIELRVPCDKDSIEPLGRLLAMLKTGLPQDAHDSVVYAFREMLRNAVEHGGKNDPSRYVEIAYMRTPRMILYRIKDPGEGFRMETLDHSAVMNPADDPMRHERLREEQGMRPGGFGILIARRMVDEVIYNEHHNEVALIKYLDAVRTESN